MHAMGTIVTDEAGEYGSMGASSNPDGPYAAVDIAWKVPARARVPRRRPPSCLA